MSDKIKKDIRYTNKDFGSFRQNLIDFAKTYFPNTYNDFNESDPGMMFIEMASYIGDVLSYYTDDNLKESLLPSSTERSNVLSHSNTLGYKAKNVVSAQTEMNVYQLLPSIGAGINTEPDWSYALTIEANMVIKSKDDPKIEFRTLNSVDFGFSGSFDETEVTVYELDEATHEPLYYLLRKTVPAVSGKIKTATFTFGDAKIYDKLILDDTNIIDILSVMDSDDDSWFHTPYLAQTTVFEPVANIAANDPDLSQYKDSAPYLLKLKTTAKRYITRLRPDDKMELQFGSGVSADLDEMIIPSPENIGSILYNTPINSYSNIDPSNFLYTKTYGLAPANTDLVVTYTVGDGIKSNVKSNILTELAEIKFDMDETNLDQTLLSKIKGSVAVNNPKPAKGGRFRETDEEIKNNAAAFFGAQNRMVTGPDFMVRAYSMPSKYGSIAKTFITSDDQISSIYPGQRIPNPLAMNMYVLGYDADTKLIALNDAIKENLKSYMSEYRMLTDGINIKDAFIVNLGIEFDVIIFPDYNSNEVLLSCVEKLSELFNITKWQINQPILRSSVVVELDKIEGVQSVADVRFVNLYDLDHGYSGNVYDLDVATKDGIIYPSMDPCIFEIKYPNKDIKGRVVTY